MGGIDQKLKLMLENNVTAKERRKERNVKMGRGRKKRLNYSKPNVQINIAHIS